MASGFGRASSVTLAIKLTTEFLSSAEAGPVSSVEPIRCPKYIIIELLLAVKVLSIEQDHTSYRA